MNTCVFVWVHSLICIKLTRLALFQEVRGHTCGRDGGHLALLEVLLVPVDVDAAFACGCVCVCVCMYVCVYVG
jgi:hypothetical protein